MADLSQGLLGGSINDLLAYIDSRRKVLAQNVGGLLGMGGPNQTPADTANGLLGDLAGRAQGQLQAAQGTQSVFPEIRDEAQQQMLNGLLNSGGLLGQTVFHGTPHKFDKFDLSKIGTGEGAQAYGHGMYFAENPDVAKSYMKGGSFDFGPIAPPDIAEDLNLTLKDMQNKFRAGGSSYAPTPQDAIQKVVSDLDTKMKLAAQRGDFETYTKAAEQRLAANRLSGAAKEAPGNLLHQDLPDSVLPKMLQWDKPLSEQPEAVKFGLSGTLADNNLHGFLQEARRSDVKGGTLVKALQENFDPATQTNFWRNAGIPGLSYLDAGSRMTGDAEKIVANYGSREKALQIAQQRLKSASLGDNRYWQGIVDQLQNPQTMNHVIWDQGLLDQMTPTPYKP